MSETSLEHRSDEQQPRPKPFSQTREATAQIARGLKQLASALIPPRSEVTRQVGPIGRAAFVVAKVAAVAGVLVFVLLAGAMLWVLSEAPLERRAGLDGPSLMIEAANGEPLGRVGPLGDAIRRQEFPDMLVKAVISIEDRRFYDHFGVDLRGIARAAFANWTAGEIVEGGSTITQQLAKMEVVGAERTMRRKLREALIAFWLELRLGKEEILTRYLNTVYLGAGAHGMSAAARMYFDKSVAELTLAESAMLAGLIQAPSRYTPVRDPEAARIRASAVIDAMRETGAIDAAAAETAKAQPATLKLSPRTAQSGSWFADWVARHEVPKLAGSVKRALQVRTTLQPDIQQLAERIVNESLSSADEARGAGQAALVAMRPDGAVLAMVGGRDYEESQFNRAVDARRQPGSTFKLFVYYAALRKGYSPDDKIDASPIEVQGWKPENYDGQQFGRMTLSQSFARSVNSAAIRLGQTVGLDEVVLAARELGLDAPLKTVPSMALGTNEVTLLDLTGAFASVRAGRPKLEPWGIAAFGPEGSGLRSLSPPAASGDELLHHDKMTRLLRDVVEQGSGRAARLDDGKAAGKTGTSQDYRDAWFIGFTDVLVVGVWTGNDDRAPMEGVTGGSLPAQIWNRFVSAATPMLDRQGAPMAAAPEPAAEATPTSADLTSATTPAPPKQAQSQCDQSACAAEYSSFRASDCTYQPLGGGARRICDKAPQASSQLVGRSEGNTARGGCDRERCARRYRSFDEGDCSYQPYEGGPRRVCVITGDFD
jgi:penicillin-binding protein 1A